jgi:hypothetical protein
MNVSAKLEVSVEGVEVEVVAEFLVGDDEPLALVVLHRGAVFPHQRLDLHGVESAAGENEAVVVRALPCVEAADDALDIRFVVDPGEFLKLLPAVVLGLGTHGLMQVLPEFRRHDFPDLNVRHDRRRTRHIPELIGGVAVEECSGGKAGVVGDKAGAEPNNDDQ